MPDEIKVGEAFIEITPRLKTAQARAQTTRYLQSIAKEMDDAFGKGSQNAINKVREGIRGIERGRQGVLKDINAEIRAHQKLQKVHEAQKREQMKAFDAEKKKIADSISAQKALAKQKADAQAADKKAIDRTLAELNQWYDKKQAIEKAQQAESLKAAQQFQSDMDKTLKYRTARAAGANPWQAGQYATGQIPTIAEAKKAQMAINGLPRVALDASNRIAKAFDNASHSLSQLSTRIGLASFQLQLLGGFATTFFTGPAVMGLTAMARDGLKFAVSVDYARASMKALLGPAADVEKIIRDIQKMAIDSPLFNTEEAIAYTQKLAAVGVKEKDLTRTMKALNNIFLTGGVAGPERASLALMAYTQILSKGTIGMDDLRQQLAEHLPNAFLVFGEAAKILGYKDLPALQKAMKEGKVSSIELNEAIITLGNSDKYLNGATAAAQTLGGVWQGFVEEMRSRLGMAFDANRAAIINAINGIRPVVMSFIDAVVAALPTLLSWLGRLITRIQDIKAKYDALAQPQKDLIRNMILLGLAAGPAAIAFGIFGTAVSGAANALSILYKTIALVGGTTAALSGWIAAAVFAIGAVVVAVGVLYTKSERMRNAVEKVLNRIKDFIATIFLPVVDMLIGSLQSLEKTFGFLGLKSEHLAYVLLLLATPLAMLVLAMGAVVIAIKAVQLVMLVLASIAYAVLNAVAYLIMGFRELFELIAKIPGAESWAKPIAESADRSAKKLGSLVDVGGQWKGLTEANSTATDGLQQALNRTDLTVTGLGGAFAGLNGHTDQAIRKQITLEEAINNARSAMEGQKSAAVGLQDASDNYNKSLLALKESIKQNKRTLNEKTEAGQRNRDMLKNATQASYEMMLQDIRSGVPMDQAIKRHKQRTDALKKEFGKNKETQAAAQKLIDTYGKVPEDVVTLLKTMGYPDVQAKLIEILAQQKVAANPQMDPRKAIASEKKAWALEKKEGLKGPGYKTGGLIRGPGGPTGDKIPIMASDEEYMIQAKSVRNLGKSTLDFINKTGTLPIGGEYAKGGLVKWPVSFDLSKTKIPELIGGGPNSGGMGVARMMAVLRQAFPGLPLISGYRPGSITSTGNRSYHSMGRAVDLPPRADVFNWISQRYGRGTKELIYTPMGGRQIKNGKPHVFSGGTIQQDHYDHVHWAYDNGGLIKPDTPYINKTGASELALNAAQGAALEDKIANSDRPVYVSVYVDGVKRDAEIVFDEKMDEVIRTLGGV